MSKYTTQLRFILEALTGESEPIEVIKRGKDKIFDFDYTFYDEDEKEMFEEMFLKHFYFSEIGCETYAQWKFQLSTWLNVNMPYYNGLLQNTLKLNQLDIFMDKNITSNREEQRNEQNNSNKSSKASSEQNETTTQNNETLTKQTMLDNTQNTGRTSYSDTPQNGIEAVESGEYLTTYTYNNDSKISNGNEQSQSETAATGKTTSEKTDAYSEDGEHTSVSEMSETYTYRGKEGGKTYSEMYGEYVQYCVNVNKVILHDMEKLFMQLW